MVISRPLGLDFSLVRRLGAGLLAFAMTTSVIRAITPDSVISTNGNFPAFWYLLLGTLISVVVAMVVLVVVEALVPSGSLPGPVALARAAPRRLRRGRRYLRITRILLHHGWPPGDLDILLRLCHRLQQRTRWGRSPGVAELAEGFAGALREELDFRVEARNAAAVAAGSAVRDVPAVHALLATAIAATTGLMAALLLVAGGGRGSARR